MKYLLSLFWLLAAAVAQADPLPAEEVFKPEIHQSATADGYRTEVTIHFPDGYYLYADKTTLGGVVGEESRTPAEAKEDPYLGPTQVWHQPPTITLSHRDRADTFTLKTQGCEENVICYPPTSWTLQVPPAEVAANEAVMAQRATAANVEPADTAAAAQPSLFQTKKNEVLPEDQAFLVDAQKGTNGQLDLHYQMPEGYYLYRHSLKAELDGKPLALPLPEGERHQDDFLGEQEIYRNTLRFSLPDVQGKALTLHLQGCAEGLICYPPIQRQFHFEAGNSAGGLTTTPAVAAETPAASPAVAASSDTPSAIVQKLNDHFFIALPLVLLLGIGVSFTACVYPLVPIVTSLVVGKNTSTARAYRLISVYVLAMGAAMALLGAVFGIFQINLQVILQKPWITVLVALLFAGLSLSLFDVYTLQTPRWLQKPVDKLNRKQQSGSYSGAAAMGALSILVVSPCATPVLTALLLFTTQTTPLKGATALFFFGLGTGLPLLLFAGAFRKFLPKAGAWMDNVKKGFAFALLAIAVWLVARILPLAWALAAWTLYALLFATYIYGDSKTRRFLAGLGLTVAIALGVQSAAQFFAPPAVAVAQAQGAAFRELHSKAEIEAALAASNKPVLLDFYADWCVACKKWEANIWHNPRFAADLAGYTLLKIDVTDFNDAHKAIFNALNLVGPPAVLYYPPHGQLAAPQEKIIGEQNADDFAAKLAEWRKK